MELERTDVANNDSKAKLEAWFEKVDQLLEDEEIVLRGLQSAVRGRTMTEAEAQENFKAYQENRKKPD